MEREKQDSEVSNDENEDRDRLPSLKPGYWTWDEATHGIVFIPYVIFYLVKLCNKGKCFIEQCYKNIIK